MSKPDREIEALISKYRHDLDNRKASTSGSERSNLLAAVRMLDAARQMVSTAGEFVMRANDDELGAKHA